MDNKEYNVIIDLYIYKSFTLGVIKFIQSIIILDNIEYNVIENQDDKKKEYNVILR